MIKPLWIFQGLSSGAFIIYGLSCLYSPTMQSEFVRFGLKKFRVLTGVLEILGGIGLIVGYFNSAILALSSAGLCALMLLGTATRIYIRDSLLETLPALILLGINLWIFIHSMIID